MGVRAGLAARAPATTFRPPCREIGPAKGGLLRGRKSIVSCVAAIRGRGASPEGTMTRILLQVLALAVVALLPSVAGAQFPDPPGGRATVQDRWPQPAPANPPPVNQPQVNQPS